MAKHKLKRKRPGMPPGSLIFTGKQLMEKALVQTTHYRAEHFDREEELSLPTLPIAEGVVWMDVRGLHDAALIEQIGQHFGIHPLVLEDVLNPGQRPKFEEYESGIFVTAKALRFEDDTEELETEQISIFFGQGFLVSFQENEQSTFLPVHQRLEAMHGRIRQRGPDYLAYALIDCVTDHYFTVLDQFEQAIERLEAQVLEGNGHGVKARIHRLKIQALHLRKTVAPLREAIGQWSRAESLYIAEGSRLFVRDLYDHAIQVLDTTETYRDMLNGLYDLYLSEISLRLNQVMKFLTIISTIFIPLTFLAGIYGMNFEHMPELGWHYGYLAVWALMVVITLGLLYFFRKKGWV
jgi:magnesium transporter